MGRSCSKWANINQSARLLPLGAKISFIAPVSLLQQHCLFKDNTWKICFFTVQYLPLFCHWQPFYFLPIQPEHPNSPIPTFLSFFHQGTTVDVFLLSRSCLLCYRLTESLSLKVIFPCHLFLGPCNPNTSLIRKCKTGAELFLKQCWGEELAGVQFCAQQLTVAQYSCLCFCLYGWNRVQSILFHLKSYMDTWQTLSSSLERQTIKWSLRSCGSLFYQSFFYWK